MHADGGAELFMDAAKVPVATRDWLGNTVSVAGREAPGPSPGPAARQAGPRGSRRNAGLVRTDPARTADAVVVGEPTSCLLPKACKNAERTAGRLVRRTKEMRWQSAGSCTFSPRMRIGAAKPRCRPQPGSLAFQRAGCVTSVARASHAISGGAGEHGAIIHYRVTDESNRSIRPNEIYLIDSGAQYPGRDNGYHPHGVDRARRAPPQALREQVTRVLKGHIAIASLVFPHGTDGRHLDAFTHAGRCGKGGPSTTTMEQDTASEAICRCTRVPSAWSPRPRSADPDRGRNEVLVE